MKKLLSVILAIVMLASCAALSLQAFASDNYNMTRIDVDFTCDPKEGAKVGSDYTIGLSGTDRQGNTDISFLKSKIFVGDGYVGGETNQEALLHGGIGGYEGYYVNSTYVVITKDDNEIVYPYVNFISYAPKRTEDSDPTAARGHGYVYELGSKYNYYLVTEIESPQHLDGVIFDVYINGQRDGYHADGLKYHDDHTLVYYLGSRYIGHDVNTVNITFSCNPENGAPVGSDYEIDVDVEADLAGNRELTVSPGEPLINCPRTNGQYQYWYNKSMVAIYESDTILYPGYDRNEIYYAPARKAHAQAHGSDPTGELGIGESNTPAFYATGKTYQYYAIIEIGEAPYYNVTDGTEVFVNGIKVTDFTNLSGRYLQIPVATVTCAHVHDMTYHAAVAATVDAEGNVAYYHCEGCGKNFADEAGTQEIANVVIDKLPNTEPHTDPATEPTTEPAQGDDVCAYCGKVHTGPFAGLTSFIHRIILFFRNIFKR